MSLLTTSIQPFLDYLKFEKRYSVHTLSSYQGDLAEFSGFLQKKFGELSLAGINHSLVRSWLAELKGEGVSSRTINRKISTLRSFFKYQLKTEQLDSSPMSGITAPKIGKRLPVFIKEDESKNMIDALDQSTENWDSLNTKMLVTIFYATGMRLSELINLKEKQVDFAKSQIKVLGKGNKERIIPVHKVTLASIREYSDLKKRDFGKTGEILLVTGKGKRMYPQYAYRLVRSVLEQASTLDKKSPHVLRHTFATHLMNQGADLNAVKELLGHSSLAATQVYTHNTIEKLKNVHKKAHPKA